MIEFLSGIAASVGVVILVWSLYALVYFAEARKRAMAACWWLPIWRCFRLVIRNMDRAHPITALRYRVWLREARAATAGSSSKTWVDRELAYGDRILLP